MAIMASGEALSAAVGVIHKAQARCGITKVVAVDGPSGAGKTDFAAVLTERLPGAQLLHMDDLYPGWDGLAQAVTDLHALILAPLAGGRHPAYRRWDWERSRYARHTGGGTGSAAGMPGGRGCLPPTSCWWKGWVRARDLAGRSCRL